MTKNKEQRTKNKEQRTKNKEQKKTDYRNIGTVYFGNWYGLHDGYGGAVFGINGISKTLNASHDPSINILVID